MKGEISIRQPDDREFEEVKKYVEEFWLDNENMQKEQFRILHREGRLAAFGRLKEHSDATELCTLGVIKDLRGKDLGRDIVGALINVAKKDVYLVTVIPDYFGKLGFVHTERYPASLQRKVSLCSTHYHVGEEYKVMRYPKPLKGL